MRSPHPFAVALVAVAAACSTKSAPEPGLPAPAGYDVSADVLKSAILDTLDELGVTIESGDPARGLVRTNWKRMSPRTDATPYMDCGGDPALGAWTEAPGFGADYSLAVQVESASEGKRTVLVRASFAGTVGSQKRQCMSKGAFEREVLEKIDSHMKGS